MREANLLGIEPGLLSHHGSDHDGGLPEHGQPHESDAINHF